MWTHPFRPYTKFVFWSCVPSHCNRALFVVSLHRITFPAVITEAVAVCFKVVPLNLCERTQDNRICYRHFGKLAKKGMNWFISRRKTFYSLERRYWLSTSHFATRKQLLIVKWQPEWLIGICSVFKYFWAVLLECYEVSIQDIWPCEPGCHK
jgi:hypothetical protein